MTGVRDRSSWVNTAITASGATLALGMMFLKTNNVSVASAPCRARHALPPRLRATGPAAAARALPGPRALGRRRRVRRGWQVGATRAGAYRIGRYDPLAEDDDDDEIDHAGLGGFGGGGAGAGGVAGGGVGGGGGLVCHRLGQPFGRRMPTSLRVRARRSDIASRGRQTRLRTRR